MNGTTQTESGRLEARIKQLDDKERAEDICTAISKAARTLGVELKSGAQELIAAGLNVEQVEGEWRSSDATWRPLDDHIVALLGGTHRVFVDRGPSESSGGEQSDGGITAERLKAGNLTPAENSAARRRILHVLKGMHS